MIKDNIKNLRIEYGYSQKELAKILCVSPKTVSHWEAGYAEPPLSIIVQLKRLFNVPYEDILE